MANEKRTRSPRPTRRDFLRATSIALPSIPIIAGSSPLDELSLERPGHPVIDCHTHFYDPTRPEGVPWPSKDDKVLFRRVLPEHLKSLAEPLGITGTVVVEASPWVEDNQWVLDLAKDDPFVVGLVGHIQPGSGEFARHLRRFVKNSLFRGIRIGSADLLKGLEQDAFINDLKLLVDHDLELDINGGPDMPQLVGQFNRRMQELRIVINHVANVAIDGKSVPVDWLKGMQEAAKGSNVFCKLSALVEGAARNNEKAPTDVDFYRPVLDAVCNAFGEDRIVFGSNWPVSERFASYAAVVQILRDYFQGKGTSAAEKFFWRNSMKAYQWVKR